MQSYSSEPGQDFKSRFQGKMQKISRDGAIEDMTQLSNSKPVQKVSIRQLQESDSYHK